MKTLSRAIWILVYYIQFGVQNLFTLAKFLKSFSSLVRPQLAADGQGFFEKKSKNKISSRYNHKNRGIFPEVRHNSWDVIQKPGRIFMPRKSFPSSAEKIESVFQFWYCIFIHFKPYALYGKHPVGARIARPTQPSGRPMAAPTGCDTILRCIL